MAEDLTFDLNGTAVIVMPESQVPQVAWDKIQDRIRQEGVSTLPLDADGDNCDILKGSEDPWEYSEYFPKAIYSWSRKLINISATLKMKKAVSSTNDDFVTILKGLPTILSHLNMYNVIEVHPTSGQSFTLDGYYTTEGFYDVYKESALASANSGYDPSSYDPDDPTTFPTYFTAFTRETAQHWTFDPTDGTWSRRYTPSGVLQINFVTKKTKNTAAFNIGIGDIITISTQPYSLATKAGAHIFPRIYPEDIQRVSEWIKNHRGKYDYTNNGRWRRTLAGETIYNYPDTGYGATDCSGMIYQAFRYGAGKSVPDGTKVMCGYGRVVTLARAGEELDVSLLREGDIVGWITAVASSRLGACHHVGIVVKGMPGDDSDTKLRIWHQTTTFNCYTQMKEDGDTKADHVIASYQPFIHNSVVSYVAGDSPVAEIVYGPQPVASQPIDASDPTKFSVSRNTGDPYTDANYNMGDARIVVRWLDDSDDLRVPDMNFYADDIDDNEAN